MNSNSMPRRGQEREMKKFEVEFRRTSYIVITVQAESKDEAEDEAWKELEFLATQPTHVYDSSWDVESIEEI